MSPHSCPVCRSTAFQNFVRRHAVPVHQNLVLRDYESAVGIPRGDMDLVLCEECGFVFNRLFDQSLLAYGSDYDNTQACSGYFSGYLDDLVRHLVVERGVRNRRILEIGSGTGLFLRKLVAYEGAGNLGHGFDPSYIGSASEMGGRLRFEKRYYGTDCSGTAVDVVICRHVLEHIPDPVSLMCMLRNAVAESEDGRLFVETPSLEWILDEKAFWDLFYEHCSYFTAKSLATALEAGGFAVQEVSRTFNGQYLWAEAQATRGRRLATATGQSRHLANCFVGLQESLMQKTRAWISRWTARGGVAVWGAGAKGATFVNLVDPTATLINCVVDLNPNKQGGYVPGTGHAIVDFTELGQRGVGTVVLMNPNYMEECLELLHRHPLSVDLVSVAKLSGALHEADN